MSRNRKIIVGIFGILLAGFLIIQVIPIGRIRAVFQRDANPPVVTTVEWDSPETLRLARMACFDCHSNETVYPWYSLIAPVSWLVTRDINQGRAAMNFSEDAPTEYNLEDLEYHLYNNMPPRLYIIMHPETDLTDEQKALLMTGFQATFTQASHEGMDMDE